MQTAILTASYGADFERCRLLCDSIDERLDGFSTHYLLVEKGDVARFSSLAGPRRVVIDEREILPSWIKVFPDPLTLGRRRIWLTNRGLPLRGWHVQQLRKIAMTMLAPDHAVLSCDSDTVFARDADTDALWRGKRFHFYRRPGAIAPDMSEHRAWSVRAAKLLGIAEPAETATDYIAQCVGWRVDTMRDMAACIEAVTGRSWQSAICASRAFSECMIYGRFVDEVEGRPDRHASQETSLSHTYWSGAALDVADLRRFAANTNETQPIFGVQSFTGTDVRLMRDASGLK